MKISKNLKLKNFQTKFKSNYSKKILSYLISDKNNEVFNSLKPSYKYSFSKKKIINKYKKYQTINLIGMGGSVLGTKAIYYFLKHKIKKKIEFIDNLNSNILKKSNKLNIIISKSGNTLETISNINIIVKKNQKNIFVTENKKNYLRSLGLKLKSEIIDHNNYIGGRYSVLSEVGMLPISLIGLKEKKFKQFNNLIKNKNFLNNLIQSVDNIYHFIKRKKYNSIILNYDEYSEDLFKWYQQLVAESLGKKQNGIMPIISTLPKDNHSLMQLYLDGPKNNFFTFFHVKEKNSNKIIANQLLEGFKFLKNKKISGIINAQKKATENVFSSKNIPYRSFTVNERSEEILGQLFTFFILETVLLGRLMKINPYDQPAVELIKKETYKQLS